VKGSGFSRRRVNETGRLHFSIVSDRLRLRFACTIVFPVETYGSQCLVAGAEEIRTAGPLCPVSTSNPAELMWLLEKIPVRDQLPGEASAC
jgi:hypothetical protein